jgi:4-hydroxybenzoate polyprenyltransferase
VQFLKALISLIRVKQWVKNFFVFAPLIFSNSFLDPQKIKESVFAFILFSLAASGVYIVNDLLDLSYDKKHPIKSIKRPIANGSISITQALGTLLAIYAAILGLVVYMDLPESGVIGFYICVNLVYSKWLKNLPIIDMFIVASGFVFRVLAGSLAIHVSLSAWMFITTFSLALFLASIKRRQELVFLGRSKSPDMSRMVLSHYSIPLMDKIALISCISTVLYYSMFVLTIKMELIYSIPIVMYGIFRYWMLVEIFEEGESPTDLVYKDPQIFVVTLIWALYSGYEIFTKN